MEALPGRLGALVSLQRLRITTVLWGQSVYRSHFNASNLLLQSTPSISSISSGLMTLITITFLTTNLSMNLHHDKFNMKDKY
jgi:hypothetical protein